MSFAFHMRHRHAGAPIALDIAFEVPEGGVTALFGPSGSGKSTAIAAAAGLLRPDFCRMAVGGVVLANSTARIWVPAERRRIGLVFQDARLFPHMSVATNLRYGQRRAEPGGLRFDDVVDLLGLAGLLPRRPRTLSGGERQLVAIGRALLANPRLLLLDEPLASLDGARKAEILPYLARLKTALRLPVLYVTHAMDEVARLADSIVLIEAGRVVASGPLSEISGRSDVNLAARDDAGAVLDGLVERHDRGRRLTQVAAGGAVFLVPLLEVAAGASVRLRIPAREVILATERPGNISMQNIIPGTIRKLVDDPIRRAITVEVALPKSTLLSRITPDAVARLGLTSGSPVLALIKSTSIDLPR